MRNVKTHKTRRSILDNLPTYSGDGPKPNWYQSESIIIGSPFWMLPPRMSPVEGILVARPRWDVAVVCLPPTKREVRRWMIYRSLHAEAEHRRWPAWDSMFATPYPKHVHLSTWAVLPGLKTVRDQDLVDELHPTTLETMFELLQTDVWGTVYGNAKPQGAHVDPQRQGQL